MAQVAISFYVIAAYKRTHEWGFGLIALATIIYFWNVGFYYFVQLGLFVPEARWSKRDYDLIYALDAGAYIVGAELDVLGIARLMQGLPQCTTGGIQPRSNRTLKPTATRCAITFSHD